MRKFLAVFLSGFFLLIGGQHLLRRIGRRRFNSDLHTNLRYPTTVFIDQSTRLADEERWFEMSDLQPR